MKKIISLTLLTIAAFHSSAQHKITGGYSIGILQVPWQVLLKVGDQGICGGSLISPQHIITAKHCVNDLIPSTLNIVVGTTCRNAIEVSNVHSVKKIILHPTLDVALLELVSPVIISENVEPIEIATRAILYEVGMSTRVSGWGWLTPNGYDPATCLQAVDVKIISNASASAMLNTSVGDHEIATTGVGSIRQGACHGDSGGPLTAVSDQSDKHVLIGVVSWGKPRCIGDNNSSPSIYVKTLNIFPWILKQICTLTGPTLICDQATYSVEHLPAGVGVTWSCSGNLRIASGQGTGRCTVARVGSQRGTGWVEVSLSTGVGNVALPQHEVWLGKPSFRLSGTSRLYVNSPGIAVIDGVEGGQGISEVAWSYQGPLRGLAGDEHKARYRAGRRPGFGTLYADACNSCGCTEKALSFCVEEEYPLALHPNPATSSTGVTVTLPRSEAPTARSTAPPWLIQLWDGSAHPVRSLQSEGFVAELSLAGLRPGVYTVTATRGQERFSGRLVVR